MRRNLVIIISAGLLLLPLVFSARPAAAQQDPPRWDCCFHIYSAGSNLGWASSLLNYTTVRTRLEPADETTLNNLLRAGEHIEAAARTCSTMNPAWRDWANRQQYLAEQVNAVRRRPDTLTRNQVASNIRSTYLWGGALRVRVFEGQEYQHDTCAEKYFRLGFLLGYAQQTLGIAEEAQRSGRHDFTTPINDARQKLRESLQVLNEYFNLAGCTNIRDLNLQRRINDLIEINPNRLNEINVGMRTIWETLQQRLSAQCETAVRPQPAPTPPGGSGQWTLVGVWRGQHPQSPTVQFKKVANMEMYVGFIVELGYMRQNHVGDRVFNLHRVRNFFTGMESWRRSDGLVYYERQVRVEMTSPDTFVITSVFPGNDRWTRIYTP